MSQKILIYDIETSPIVGYTWGTWQQDVIEVLQDWQILCFAYKWYGEKRTHVIAQDDYRDYKPGELDDTNVTRELRRLFNEADVVVAHNGNKFDQKKSQARMMLRGLEPPSPYKQIDTKVVAKRYAALTSNKLDDLGTYFGLGNKVQTGGFKLWTGCMAGDKKAWKKMKKYNKQDVVLLEKVYEKLRPWMANHPAMNIEVGNEGACPKCGVKGRMQRRGFSTTKTNKYQQYQCMACGGWSRRRLPEFRVNKVDYVN